jgi:lipopolysaccharide export system protein LptC
MVGPLSSIQAIDETGDRGFTARTRRDGDRAFRRAMRHSRRVRRLRVVLPVLLALILTATALVRWLDPLRVLASLPASTKGLVISGTKIKMEAPKLSGYTNDSRRYELSAESAAQDITKPNIIELNQVRAKLQAPDNSTVNLSAVEGVFDRSTGMLTLDREIKLASDNGLEIRLDDAIINTVTSEVVSSKPVEMKTQQGTIRSDRLEVLRGGEVVSFIGGVVVTLATSDLLGALPSGKP